MAKAKKPPPTAAPPSSRRAAGKPARAAEAPVARDARENKTPVVAIGASAGGLEAVSQLLGALPADTGMAFVHIQHLDPQHDSLMVELLRGATHMKVVEATDDTALEPNVVYVGPRDRDVSLRRGRLRLTAPAEPPHVRLPIDFFFRAVARDKGERCIGVVLSGTGSDGTLGLRAIKAAGGMTIVQTPKSAKFDGMPRSAIATQQVDFVATPQEIPRILLDFEHHPYTSPADAVAATPAGQLEQIFLLLREQTGHDFSHYKQNTIRRRMERRMAVHHLKRLDDYLRHLQRFPVEVEALFKDLLIGVTNFFRDPEAFKSIEERIVPRLFEQEASQSQLRIWVPGCSTGEEAYSLAILLADQAEQARSARKVCIFATDIDPGAIDIARAALYPESIAGDVPPDRLRRHLVKENGAYRIAKRVRETVIFAVQDILKDPPFSKLDLISCRNLFIYLEPALQRKLLQLFHAVLNPGGFLILGASETVGDAGELFASVDKKWKLFEKKPVTPHPLLGVTALHILNEGSNPLARVADPTAESNQPSAVGEVTSRLLLDSYAPACVVVDERNEVVYLQGKTGRYLDLPVGEPSLNLLKMARDEVLRELRVALHRATKERAEVVREGVPVTIDGALRLLRLRVKPFSGPRPAQRFLLVAFEEMPPPSPAPAEPGATGAVPADPRVAELERELGSIKESLQSTVEEVETSNEELRSTNEELQSANEELQSTNEELETSKEELQSVNEELMTVNNELQKKLEELSQTNNDLTNLLNSTEIGTIFLDNDLRIKRFTPAVAKLVNLIPTDVGRPVADIVTQIRDDALADDAREVLRTLVFRESEVRTKDGRSFLRRILPYRTVDNVIDGVVVTFVNITEVREAQRMVEAALVYASNIVDALRQPVLLLSKDARIIQVNKAFYSLFQLRKEETLGASLYKVDGGRFAVPEVRRLLDAALDDSGSVDGQELVVDLPQAGRRRMHLQALRTAFGTKAVAGEDELTMLTMEDGGQAAS